MNYDRMIERNVEYWGHCKKCGVFHTHTGSFWASFKKMVLRKSLMIQNRIDMTCNQCWRNQEAKS